MKLFNSNAVHNFINVAITIVCGGALVGFDWTMLGVTDRVALQISGSLALLKLIINAVRDGPSGMVEAAPSQRGIEVARQVDEQIPKDEPIVILTPSGQPDIVVPAQKGGA